MVDEQLSVSSKDRAADGTLHIKLAGGTTAFTFTDCSVGWKGDVLVIVPNEEVRHLQPFRELTALQSDIVGALRKSFKRVGDGVSDSVRVLHVDEDGKVVIRLQLEAPMPCESQDLMPCEALHAELVCLQKDSQRGRVRPLWQVTIDSTPSDDDDDEEEVLVNEEEAQEDAVTDDVCSGDDEEEIIVKIEDEGAPVDQADEWQGVVDYIAACIAGLEETSQKRRSDSALFEHRVQQLRETLEAIRDMQNEPIGDVLECVEEYKAAHAALLG